MANLYEFRDGCDVYVRPFGDPIGHLENGEAIWVDRHRGIYGRRGNCAWGIVGAGHRLKGCYVLLDRGALVQPHGEGAYEVTRAGGLAVFDAVARGRRKLGTLAVGTRFQVYALDGEWGKIGGSHPHRDRWVQLPGALHARRVGNLVEPLLLTLHAGDASPEGLVDVVATNIGGEEVASFQADLSQDVRALEDAILRELEDMSQQRILLMLPDGSILHDAHVLLSDVLQG